MFWSSYGSNADISELTSDYIAIWRWNDRSPGDNYGSPMTFYKNDDCTGLSYTVALFEPHCWGATWYDGKSCIGKLQLDISIDGPNYNPVLNP